MTARYSCSNSLTWRSTQGHLDLVEAGDEPVDLLGDRVEVEARARRRRDPEPRHQRLCAVMPRADGDAFPVEDLRDVVRMNALHVEGDDPGAPLGRRPEDPHPRHLVEGGHRLLYQHVLVALDRVEPDGRDVLQRGAEA